MNKKWTKYVQEMETKEENNAVSSLYNGSLFDEFVDGVV